MPTVRDNDSNDVFTFDHIPDTCPVCRRAAEIKRILPGQGHAFPDAGNEAKSKLQILFECPSHTCSSWFIVEYGRTLQSGVGLIYCARKFYPLTAKGFDVVEGIAELSPQFAKIANQAAKAEADGLEEIAGIGYRKALEFLIKDYCIKVNPAKAPVIKKLSLAQCIEDFVKDSNIKTCAKRAVWIGNDEAHYERVWTDHDVKDLKMLIRLTQHWISNERLTEQYLKDIDPKKE